MSPLTPPSPWSARATASSSCPSPPPATASSPSNATRSPSTGGDVHLPGDSQAHTLGLIDRLKLEEPNEHVQVVEDDFLDGEPLGLQCDAVWKSCSWHYSANHHRPLGEFVDRMQRLVRPGGIFGAEFMMPVERRHHMIEHYTSPERLHPHFIGDWEVLLTLRTTEFTERPHVGQLHDHTHRMGLLLAARTFTLTDHF
ncbi:class I SAM-dependent methyltransferase [Streptomyces sp. YPW6]|uniref:class I SAM-dependent methyltransferase n=1 Tax=Streptomyces sp. YPW6 TaxID=2840373 RepID=UPI003EB89AA7